MRYEETNPESSDDGGVNTSNRFTLNEKEKLEREFN